MGNWTSSKSKHVVLAFTHKLLLLVLGFRYDADKVLTYESEYNTTERFLKE